MMAWARTVPMSKSLSSSSALAVLRLTFSPGASLAGVALPFSAAAGLAGEAGSLVAAGFSAAGAGAGAGVTTVGLALGGAAFSGPTMTSSFRAATLALLRPLIWLKSSTLLKGRAAMIFLAVVGPTPGRASKAFWSEVYRSTRDSGTGEAASP